jgi:hypothetical protein
MRKPNDRKFIPTTSSGIPLRGIFSPCQRIRFADRCGTGFWRFDTAFARTPGWLSRVVILSIRSKHGFAGEPECSRIVGLWICFKKWLSGALVFHLRLAHIDSIPDRKPRLDRARDAQIVEFSEAGGRIDIWFPHQRGAQSYFDAEAT